jgi:hypothetical protein
MEPSGKPSTFVADPGGFPGLLGVLTEDDVILAGYIVWIGCIQSWSDRTL